MLRLFILCVFSCFFSLSADSIVETDVFSPKTSIVSNSEGEIGNAIQLKTKLVETYHWSADKKKYSLKESEFNFRFQNPFLNDTAVLDRGNSVQLIQEDKRYLSVHFDSQTVLLESVQNSKVQDKTLIKSKLEADRKSLVVYFSRLQKENIFNNLLANEQFKQDLDEKNQLVHSSDYYCNVQGQDLVCSMDYIVQLPSNFISKADNK